MMMSVIKSRYDSNAPMVPSPANASMHPQKVSLDISGLRDALGGPGDSRIALQKPPDKTYQSGVLAPSFAVPGRSAAHGLSDCL